MRIHRSMLSCLGLLLTVIIHIASSQQSRVANEEFVALLQSGERIEGTSFFLSPKELSGQTSTGVRVSVPLHSVKTLYVSTGSKSGQFALLGGAFGLGVGLLAVLTAESQGAGKVNYSNIGGLVAAGAVIGAVLGAGQQSWEMVDLDAFRRSFKRDSTVSHLFY